MARITTFHTENGTSYKGPATTHSLFDASGMGFDFYPMDASKIRCKVPNDSDDIIDLDTGKVIGRYDPMWKYAFIILDDEQPPKPF